MINLSPSATYFFFLLEYLDPNSNPDIFRHWIVNTIVLGNGTVVNSITVGVHLHEMLFMDQNQLFGCKSATNLDFKKLFQRILV